jgi:hypothetical protein
MSELALFFAQMYQRPETSVLVTVDEDALLTFGNTSDSAYLIKISALPSLIAPLINQRNTSLIQATLLNLLGIASDRGVIIFGSVGEDNFATNGATARGEISRLERSDHGNSPGLLKSISRSMSRRLKSSSGNSASISLAGLSTVVSPDGVAMVPGASDLPETIPLRSSQPDNAKSTELSNTESQTAKSLTLESPKEESLNQVSSKDEKKERGLKKRESLKSFVNRRLFELTGPRGASTPTPKRKNV